MIQRGSRIIRLLFARTSSMSPSWLWMSWQSSSSRLTGLLWRTCRLKSRDRRALQKDESAGGETGKTRLSTSTPLAHCGRRRQTRRTPTETCLLADFNGPRGHLNKLQRDGRAKWSEGKPAENDASGSLHGLHWPVERKASAGGTARSGCSPAAAPLCRWNPLRCRWGEWTAPSSDAVRE